jgi:hypothetical protein
MPNEQMMRAAEQYEARGDFGQAEAMRQSAENFVMPDADSRYQLLRTFAKDAKRRSADVNVGSPKGYRFIENER